MAERTLQSLTGLEIEEIATSYGKPDRVTLTLEKIRLTVPIDELVPIGGEYEDWWTDFDEFVEEVEGDEEPPEAVDGVVTLGELLGTRVARVRTGQSPRGARFVVLDLDSGMSLLLPLDGLKPPWSGFEALLDAEVSAGIQDAH